LFQDTEVLAATVARITQPNALQFEINILWTETGEREEETMLEEEEIYKVSLQI
jgi:hypothetical protein